MGKESDRFLNNLNVSSELLVYMCFTRIFLLQSFKGGNGQGVYFQGLLNFKGCE